MPITNGLYNIANAKIIFRNFRGEERKYNKAGDRNFSVVLDIDQAQELLALGFNVKERPSTDPDGDSQFLLPVSVSFKNRPPKIMQITAAGKNYLGEDTIGELDFADLARVDLSIRPYHWTLDNGNSGVKAYLNSGYFTLLEDEFAAMYADAPSEDDLPFN